MNRWHWNKGKTSQYNYTSRPTSNALPTHTWCLAANQQRSRCIRRAQCTATRSWHHSPWSSGSNSAWQSTLASFLDAALMLLWLREEPACSEPPWDPCTVLSGTHTRCILHKITLFCKLINGHLVKREHKCLVMLVIRERGWHPAVLSQSFLI